jgi:MerR family transcriptional regulator, light-induced transcriptional regulator
VYTVKRAAELTGIAPDTLRVWERRYHVVEPSRSDGGYRLYDDRALRRLSAMQALVESGWAPRQAAARVLSDESRGIDQPFADPGAPAADHGPLGDVAALARAGADLDGAALEAALDAGFALGSYEVVVDRWLMPSLQEVGAWWRSGRLTVAGEHFVSASVQRRLAAALDAAGRPEGPHLVVGLARDSRHELGVLAFATALRRAGANVVYVGSDLPSGSWPEAVRGHDAVAVVIGVPTVEDVPAVREAVDVLAAEAPEVAVYLGGGHQTAVGSGEPLGHRIGSAARDLVAALAGGASPVPAP